MVIIIYKKSDSIARAIIDPFPREIHFEYKSCGVTIFVADVLPRFTKLHSHTRKSDAIKNRGFNGCYIIGYSRYKYDGSQVSHLPTSVKYIPIIMIDLFSRINLADGAFIHCVRDYFDDFDLIMTYLQMGHNTAPFMIINEFSLELCMPAEFRHFNKILPVSPESRCKFCSALVVKRYESYSKICINRKTRECVCSVCSQFDDYLTITHYDQYTHNDQYDYYYSCDTNNQCLTFLHQQLAQYVELCAIITPIDIQFVLLLGHRYYITPVPVPSSAQYLIHGRTRLRLMYNPLDYVNTPKKEAIRYRSMFRDTIMCPDATHDHS